MKKFGLGKQHKLCSKTAIDTLFGSRDGSDAMLVYPLRAVWRRSGDREGSDDPTLRFLISVPKKKLRHAVDRVQMRRRIREAYRLHRPALVPPTGEAQPVDVAFIYVADHLEHFGRVDRAMMRILRRIFPAQPGNP